MSWTFSFRYTERITTGVVVTTELLNVKNFANHTYMNN